ncbi:MAG: PAS domain-containing protein [Sterolibacteriaceae bacterium MAG5]|nr:PAS domain-containing protein [Candidatus Nitricoxidireducens bremensis]
MPIADTPLLFGQSALQRYALALGIVLAALAVRLAILPIEAGLPYVTFYPGIAVAAFLCGTGPTLMVILLSTVVSGTLLAHSQGPGAHLPVVLTGAVAFFLSSATIWLVLRHFQQRLAVAAPERRRMVAALRQERALLASVMDTTDVMLVYLDTNFNFVWVNQAYADTCRRTPEQLVGKNHFALYPDAENEAIFRGVRDTGKPVFFKDKPFEFPDQPERGTTYWDWSLTPHREPDGRVTGLVFSLRETTAHVRAEQAVRASEAKLSLLIEHVPAGIAMLDREMRYLAVSRRFLADYRLGDVSVIGRSHYEVFPEIPDRWRELHRRGLAGETLSCEEDPFVRQDGRVDWVRWEIQPWRDAAGKIGGIIVFNEDVTAHKQAESALKAAKIEAERANEAKSRFLGAVSHDLRQPIFAISLYVDTIETKFGTAEPEMVTNLKGCVATLGDMLSNLMDLSRFDAGAVKAHVRDFDANAVMAKIVSYHAPRAHVKGLQLRVGRFDGLHGHTDPVLFQRILSNLVANALRYTERGGVLIAPRRRSGKWWIEVWDTGIGIPADMTGVIFEEFRQLPPVRNDQPRGTGIGLTIVARTAALLGLEVRVRSVVGKGSLFAVELPLGDAPAAMVPPDMHCRPLSIALVEDNRSVAEALAQLLEASGHRVVTAASGAGIVPLLGAGKPDLLLTDYRLADGETGLDVIAAVRRACGDDIPAIILTGDTDTKATGAGAQGRTRLLYKPTDFGVLWRNIEELLAETR